MILRLLVPLFLTFVALSPLARAHEIRPAYLQVDERAPHRYDVLWKVPANAGMVPDIRPTFESGFMLTPLPGEVMSGGFAIFRYALASERELPGTSLRIDKLDRTAIDVLANITLLDGTRHSLLLRPRESSVQIPGTLTGWQIVRSYTRLGIEHILEGIDHLAFVAALMLIVRGWPMLLKTVTAFTVAHSITLGLATLGYVSPAAAPVEALIALSILLVAAEAIHLRRGRQSLATRWPWTVAFAFGLLHGFGFAGALMEIGLPRGDVALALLFFNIGVELGQLSFIALTLLLLALVRWVAIIPRIAPIAVAYGIGTIAMFWLIGRLNVMIF